MSDAAERFVQNATAPLADNLELQLRAQHELRHDIRPEEPIEEALEILTREGNGKKRRSRIRQALWLCLLGLLIGLGHVAWQVWSYQQYGRQLAVLHGGKWDERSLHQLTKGLSEEKQWILYGDLTAPSKSERVNALRKHYPDDPVYLAESVAVHFGQDKSVPGDLDPDIARIDPDNGWYDYFKASAAANKAVTLNSTGASYRSGRPTHRYVIRDPEKARVAFEALEQVAKKPRFNTHVEPLISRRVVLLRSPADQTEILERRFDVMINGVHHTRELSYLINAESHRCTSTNDKEAFLQLCQLWDRAVPQITRPEDVILLECLMKESLMLSAYKSLYEGAKHFSLAEEVRYQKIIDAIENLQRKHRKPHTRPDLEEASRNGGIHFTDMASIGAMAASSPIIPPEKIKASRMADHATAGRAGLLVTGLFLLLTSGLVALYRFRHGKLTRWLSLSLDRLVSLKDLLRISTIAVLGVAAWELIIMATPLGGREVGLLSTDFFGPAFHYAALTLLLLMVASLLTIHCIRKRTPILNLGLATPYFGWVCVILTALTIPGSTLYLAHTKHEPWTVAYGLVIPVGWLLIAVTKALFVSSENALGKTMIARALAPVLFALILPCSLASLGFYLQERHWVQQTMKPTMQEQVSWMFHYETEIARIRSKELRELLQNP